MTGSDRGSEILIDVDEEDSRSWFSRTFSALGKGSLRGGIFMMLVTSLGSGIFTLHQAFGELGFVWAIVVCVYLMVVYYIVADILIKSLLQAKGSVSLSQMIGEILSPAAAKFYNVIFFLYVTFTVMAMMLMINKNVFKNYGSYIGGWFGSPDVDIKTFNFYFSYVLGFSVFWIIRLKSIDQFRYMSLISFGVVLYIIILCMCQTPFYFSNLAPEKKDFNITSFSFSGFFSKTGMICFSYNCITNFFAVSSIVHKPTVKRLEKVFWRTFFTLMCLFIAFGTCGYLSLGTDALSLDLFMYRPAIGSDYLMKTGLALQILVLSIGIGINTFPLKNLFFEMIGSELNDRRNLGFSIIFTGALTVFISFFTSIDSYISLCGSFFVTIIIFLIPGIMGFKINYFKSITGKIYLAIQTFALLVLGLVGGVLAIIKFINSS